MHSARNKRKLFFTLFPPSIFIRLYHKTAGVSTQKEKDLSNDKVLFVLINLPKSTLVVRQRKCYFVRFPKAL